MEQKDKLCPLEKYTHSRIICELHIKEVQGLLQKCNCNLMALIL